MASKERINNLKNLLKKGRLSPKLKTATKQLIIALKKGDMQKVSKYSYLHKHISSGWKSKEYPYNEDDNFNELKTGTTAYREFDRVWHGNY